jgi:hypothetical protein
MDHLEGKRDYQQYLVDALVLNDMAFTACYNGLRSRGWDAKQLRDETIKQKLSLVSKTDYNIPELLAEIAGKAGREGTDEFNATLRANGFGHAINGSSLEALVGENIRVITCMFVNKYGTSGNCSIACSVPGPHMKQCFSEYTQLRS